METGKLEKQNNKLALLTWWIVLFIVTALLVLPYDPKWFKNFSLLPNQFLVHILIFASFYFLSVKTWGKPIIIGFFVLSFSLLLELLQLLSNRQASWADFLANLVGVMVGWLIWTLVRRRLANQ